MKPRNTIAIAAAVCLATVAPLPRSIAVVHQSVFTTVELTLKQPVDPKTEMRLVSISPDGVVTVRLADSEDYTARVGDSFRNAKGRGPGALFQLVSLDAGNGSVVVRYETRVYLPSPTPQPKKPNPKKPK